uniref:Uncharacterized protein n=1 Tax=Rhizophora mucronata TaxID=61149 RepID=A0A2P2QKS9_RHIMU
MGHDLYLLLHLTGIRPCQLEEFSHAFLIVNV